MLDKTGLLTTEFWMSAVSTLFLAVFGVLIIYNILTEEQAAAWMSLAVAVTAIVIPLAIAAITNNYTTARSEQKTATIKQQDCK